MSGQTRADEDINSLRDLIIKACYKWKSVVYDVLCISNHGFGS